MAKYVVIRGCGIKGKKMSVGDAIPTDLDSSKVQGLLGQGMIVDASTDEGAKVAEAALVAAKTEKERLAGTNGDPSTDRSKTVASEGGKVKVPVPSKKD